MDFVCDYINIYLHRSVFNAINVFALEVLDFAKFDFRVKHSFSNIFRAVFVISGREITKVVIYVIVSFQ